MRTSEEDAQEPQSLGHRHNKGADHKIPLHGWFWWWKVFLQGYSEAKQSKRAHRNFDLYSSSSWSTDFSPYFTKAFK